MKKAGQAIMVMLWRVIQVMVVIPATTIGLMVLILSIMGYSPLHSTIAAIYDYADENIRPAETGHVLSRECQVPGRMGDEISNALPVACSEAEVVSISVSDAIAANEKTISAIYMALVLLSFVVLVVRLHGRSFIGSRYETN